MLVLFLVALLYVVLNALLVKMDMDTPLNHKEKETLLEEISVIKSGIEDEVRKEEHPLPETSPEPKDVVEPVDEKGKDSAEDGSAVEEPDRKGPEEEPDVPVQEEVPAAKVEEKVDYRAGVAALLDELNQSIEVEDLPEFRRQMKDFFGTQGHGPYFLTLDLSGETEDVRTVIIGDTHCDPTSLSAILQKLLLSEYDYFGRGRIVFLGDYLDRGDIFFEHFRLLVGLKKLMGDRCILLKGNHELIEFDKHTKLLDSMVYPSNTCPLLNEYCGEDKEFLSQFADYVTNLPYYILLKTKRGVDLLVHGGIPRDRYLDLCSISPDTGEMILSGQPSVLDAVLDNMIWSDPKAAPFKVQGPSARFSFGRDQFAHFMEKNHLNRLFRSHEPVENGVESFYDDRLFTIFSTGGAENGYTGYPDVLNPVFGILSVDGEIRFESIFLRRVSVQNGASSFETMLYMGRKAEMGAFPPGDLHLNPEFFVIKSF